MKSKNKLMMAAIVAVIAIGFGALTGCDLGSNSWANGMRGRFNSARYMPNLADVMPDVVSDTMSGLGQSETNRSTGQRSLEPPPDAEVLNYSDITGSYNFSVHSEYFINSFDIVRDYINREKNWTLARLDFLTEDMAQDVWHTVMQGDTWKLFFSENGGELHFYCEYDESHLLMRRKVIVYAGGNTEIYIYQENKSVNSTLVMYSVCDGNNFTYYNVNLDDYLTSIAYMSFEENSGEKTGEIVWFTKYDRDNIPWRLWATSFTGDESTLVMYSKEEDRRLDSARQTLTIMTEGAGFSASEYIDLSDLPDWSAFEYVLDIQAIDNIDRVYYINDESVFSFAGLELDGTYHESLPGYNYNNFLISKLWETDSNGYPQQTGPFAAAVSMWSRPDPMPDFSLASFPSEYDISSTVEAGLTALDYTGKATNFRTFYQGYRIPGIDQQIRIANVTDIQNGIVTFVKAQENWPD